MKRKLKSRAGLTLTEMLCSVAVVLLLSSLIAIGARAAARSFRASMADAQAQMLCSTLVSAISDKLEYCGSVTIEEGGGKIFIQDIGSVSGGSDGSVFQVDAQTGQLYLGDQKFLGSASYPEGLRVDEFQMRYDSDDGVFSVSFQIVDGQRALSQADFQVKRINS